MSQQTLREVLAQIRRRYQKATRGEKSRILIEFGLNFGYSRKHTIRLLNGKAEPAGAKSRRGPKPKYGLELVGPLKRLWLAMAQPCGKRMKAALPAWVPHDRKRHPELTDEQSRLLLSMSPATIDRLLAPIKAKRGLGTTQPPSSQWYKSVIPIQPHDWNVTAPGTLQGDTVAHCGETMLGQFANTLTMTDLHTSWTENRAVWGKGSGGIIEALKDIEKSLPFSMKTIKFDSGSEFMNYGVISHLRSTAIRTEKIQLVRSRPYRKNDNCYVEQKNLTHVRQLVGYERIDESSCVAVLNELYREHWNPLANFFLPAMKLIRKTRIGARIRKEYDTPRTPYQRLLESADTSAERRAELRARYESLDPFALQEGLERALKKLFETLKANRKPGASLKHAA